MSDHAKLSPSGADRWMNCPGSVREEAKYPDDTNEFAAEGTFCHQIAENCLTLGLDPSDFVGQSDTVDGYEFTLTSELADYVAVYVDHVRSNLDAATDPAHWVERRVHIAEDCWGTSDNVMRAGAYLHIDDAKFGFSVVEPDSSQIKLYAYGAMRDNEIAAAAAFAITSIRTGIVQPRAAHPEGSVRVKWWKPEEIEQWYWDEVVPAMNAAAEPDAPLVAGDHCTYCKHRDNCPVRQTMLDEVRTAEAVPLAQMSNEQLGAVLDGAKKLRKWLDDAEIEGMKRAHAGKPPVGKDGDYKIVLTSRHRVFKAGAEKQARARIGADAFNSSLKSPSAIGKLGEAGKKLVSEFAYQPDGSPKLAPATDTKSAVKPKASETFAEFMKG